MPSVADIPTRLLRKDRKTEFLNWVSRIPMAPYHKRAMVNLWSREMDVKISAEARVLVSRGETVPDDV